MKKVYLSLGGNLGNRADNLFTALKWIEIEIGPIQLESNVYETKAWGNENQPDFLNQVILVTTLLSPQEVLEKVLEIEHKMGRIRKRKWYTRLIDIDVLFYEDEIIDSERLTLPHPHIPNRKFVLVPLAEIAANFIHPILQKSIKTLLNHSSDSLNVKVYKNQKPINYEKAL